MDCRDGNLPPEEEAYRRGDHWSPASQPLQTAAAAMREAARKANVPVK